MFGYVVGGKWLLCNIFLWSVQESVDAYWRCLVPSGVALWGGVLERVYGFGSSKHYGFMIWTRQWGFELAQGWHG